MCHTVQEEGPSLVVGSNTLKESERIADSVGGGGCELRRVEQCIDRDDLLEERGHNTWSILCQQWSILSTLGVGSLHTERVPQYQRELGHLLPLLTKLQQRCLSRVLVEKIGDVGQGAPVVFRDRCRRVGAVGLLLLLLLGSGASGSGIVRTSNSVVVLLLSSRSSGGSGSGLLLGSMLVVMLSGLRVHPCRRGVGGRRIVLVVAVHVWILHHPAGWRGQKLSKVIDSRVLEGRSGRYQRHLVKCMRARLVEVLTTRPGREISVGATR